VDTNWTEMTDYSDAASAPAPASASAPAADDDDVDDDESSTSRGLDVSDRVTANFTGLTHSLYAWYFVIPLTCILLVRPL